MNSVIELNYHKTNTFLIRGEDRYLLFDTGAPGTLESFLKALETAGVRLSDIAYLTCSHYHSDHMGIASEIMKLGIPLVVWDVQTTYAEAADVRISDDFTACDPTANTRPVVVPLKDSGKFLEEIGIKGEILATPGHSEDSISLWLDDGTLFVGDLNKCSTVSWYDRSTTARIWRKLRKRKPLCVYYGHAKPERFDGRGHILREQEHTDRELYHLVQTIMKDIDAKYDLEKIQRKTGADKTFIEDVARMYLTHQNVGVRGILDRIEIKGR